MLKFSKIKVRPELAIGIYDMAEVEEGGYISQKHFQEFLKFVRDKKL